MLISLYLVQYKYVKIHFKYFPTQNWKTFVSACIQNICRIYTIFCRKHVFYKKKKKKREKKAKIFSVQAHQKVFLSYGQKFLKCILIYLYCTKCNEINICNFDVQKHTINNINFSCTVCHKRLCTHCVLLIETVGSVFSIEL